MAAGFALRVARFLLADPWRAHELGMGFRYIIYYILYIIYYILYVIYYILYIIWDVPRRVSRSPIHRLEIRLSRISSLASRKGSEK